MGLSIETTLARPAQDASATQVALRAGLAAGAEVEATSPVERPREATQRPTSIAESKPPGGDVFPGRSHEALFLHPDLLAAATELAGPASEPNAGQQRATSGNETTGKNEDVLPPLVHPSVGTGPRDETSTDPPELEVLGEPAPEPSEGADRAKEAAERKALGKTELSTEDKEMVRKLQSRDQEVRAHENAHLAAAGAYAAGGASYTFQQGPDGRSYAVGGEVPIDTSAESTPEASLRKAQIIQAAALAPANPSGQDMAVAGGAVQMASEAMQAIRDAEAAARQESAESNKGARERKPTKPPAGEESKAAKTPPPELPSAPPPEPPPSPPASSAQGAPTERLVPAATDPDGSTQRLTPADAPPGTSAVPATQVSTRSQGEVQRTEITPGNSGRPMGPPAAGANGAAARVDSNREAISSSDEAARTEQTAPVAGVDNSPTTQAQEAAEIEPSPQSARERAIRMYQRSASTAPVSKMSCPACSATH